MSICKFVYHEYRICILGVRQHTMSEFQVNSARGSCLDHVGALRLVIIECVFILHTGCLSDGSVFVAHVRTFPKRVYMMCKVCVYCVCVLTMCRLCNNHVKSMGANKVAHVLV
jgi:hypothetical protein